VTTATVVIDMQVDFFNHDRLAQRKADLVRSTNDLVRASRSASVPVIWVRQEFSPDLSDASLEVRRGRIAVVVAGTPGARILPELEVGDTDITIVKKRYSAFHQTPLDELLNRQGCRHLIVAGINTHACIRTTVVDAYQRDLDVVLARDCIESHDEVHGAISWSYMDGKLGRGMDNVSLLNWLRSSGDH
jgi:nicotinamidase-related amidase